jgi:hypothetical protein
MDSEKLIDNIILGDNVRAKTEFNTLIHQKTQELVDIHKKELSDDIFSGQQTIEPEQAKIQENFDIINTLMLASSGKSNELNLNNGISLPLDENTAIIILNYIKTLSEEDKIFYINSMINNERSFMKSLETASHALGV